MTSHGWPEYLFCIIVWDTVLGALLWPPIVKMKSCRLRWGSSWIFPKYKGSIKTRMWFHSLPNALLGPAHCTPVQIRGLRHLQQPCLSQLSPVNWRGMAAPPAELKVLGRGVKVSHFFTLSNSQPHAVRNDPRRRASFMICKQLGFNKIHWKVKESRSESSMFSKAVLGLGGSLVLPVTLASPSAEFWSTTFPAIKGRSSKLSREPGQPHESPSPDKTLHWTDSSYWRSL